MSEVAHPPVASREEWLGQRKALLLREKALTKERDRICAERRRLPMVRVDKPYEFDTVGGRRSLLDLFEGRRQLIVHHFMFDPAWDEGCEACTGHVDAYGDLSLLGERDTSFTLVSRAPLAKLRAYAAKRGWDRPWASSFGGDFNLDFGVTLDPARGTPEYNYRSLPDRAGEYPGFSVFFRVEDGVYHTYSAFGRGIEDLTDTYNLLDLTPYGRQEDFEESPEGWPQRPTYG